MEEYTIKSSREKLNNSKYIKRYLTFLFVIKKILKNNITRKF